jgi:hypothetical protein
MNPALSLHSTNLMKTFRLATLILTLALSPELRAASGPYFGQTPPGTNAVLFASGIVSVSGRTETGVVFSPDGRECVIPVSASSAQLYYATQNVSGTWSPQVAVPFLPAQAKSEPAFSADGNRLYFSCDTNGQTDFYYVERTPQGWGHPTPLPSPINSTTNDSCLSQATNGNYYFASVRSGSLALYQTLNGTNQPPQVSLLFSGYGNPCIAPDERFLISCGPGTYQSASDLYVSFKNQQGVWTTPVRLGSNINWIYDDFNPSLSPDAKYLFFARGGPSGYDIYWVSVAAIDNLNPLPTIKTNPVSQTALPGDNITFKGAASGTAPLRYQWWFNATNRLTSATNSTLTLTNVQLADAGSYSLVVTNTLGAITSSPALLMADPAFVKLGTAAPGALSFRSWIGVPFALECSSNLLDWSALAILTNLTGTLDYTDSESSDYPCRFYRARLP